MDIYKLKFTRLQNEIFRLLCIKAGEKLNQRQTAKLLKVSPTAIAKSLQNMKEEDLIKIQKDKDMNLVYIELNRESEKAISLKRVENLKIIYESGLNTYLAEMLPGATIILFGSYSRGDDIVSSDIDIAIIGRKRKEINIERFEKILEREIILQFYDSLKDIHKNLKNNILNGVLLEGSITL